MRSNVPATVINLKVLQQNRRKAEQRKLRNQKLKWGPAKLEIDKPWPISESRRKLTEAGIPADSNVEISNVVSTVDCQCILDPHHIALHMRNAAWNPRRFAAAVVRIQNPSATGLIFQSGKIVCLGTKSIQDSTRACQRFIRNLNKLGFKGARWPREGDDGVFKVANLVGRIKLNHTIHLEGIAIKHYLHCRYEPELFPALVWTVARIKAKVMLFATGTVIITGCQTEGHLHQAAAELCPLFLQHRF